MTSEERLTRIEENLQAASEALKIVVQVHTRTQETIADMSRSIAGYVEASTKYVEASDARMKQLEASLDALIRAITAEHSNGKSR